MHGKPGREERGRPQERKGERSTEEATVRRNREERERKKQRLSSQNPKLKRPKGSENSGGQKEKRKRQQAVKVEAQRKLEAKAEGKGESGEAAAEIDADGRRKEIADETCMKLCEWKPKGGNHRFMMVDFKNHVVSTERPGLFCFYSVVRWKPITYKNAENPKVLLLVVALRREDMVSVDIDPHAPLMESDKLIVIAHTEKLAKLR